MSAIELLSRVVKLLDDSGTAHMVCGSFASTAHGEPRTTHDIDIVIDPSEASLKRFVSLLPECDYYVDRDTALTALRQRGQFNVIDMATGWKLDFIIKKQRGFSTSEFERRSLRGALGDGVYIASAEDTIIAKLEWAQDSQSERQLRDVRSILRLSGDTLDRQYLDKWINELGLSELWATVQEQSI